VIEDDPAAFLKARLDEDAAAARAVNDHSEPWTGQWEPREQHALQTHNGWVLAVANAHGGDFAPGVVEHIARYDPARVLREVQAKRAILAVHAPREGGDGAGAEIQVCQTCSWDGNAGDVEGDPYPCETIRIELAIYRDRPGYRQEWKP
jgi:hypothetical protein